MSCDVSVADRKHSAVSTTRCHTVRKELTLSQPRNTQKGRNEEGSVLLLALLKLDGYLNRNGRELIHLLSDMLQVLIVQFTLQNYLKKRFG